ncbi:MAG: hypothetical protein AAGE94_23355, partial [Acidobacteriota bacterium]
MRLFLAVPLDLQPERDAVRRVVDRLNAQRADDPIEVVDWHQRVAPFVNLPESVAFRNVDVDPDDLFVGLSWLAFDDDKRPTVGGESVEEPEGQAVGCTERDLELAYAYWKTLARPRAVFLRCLRLPERLTDIDSRSFDRVCHFFRRFHVPEKNRFSHLPFHESGELEERLVRELRQLLTREAAIESPQIPAPRSELRGSTQFEKKMEPGKAYEVSFLGLEIEGWAERVAAQPEARDAFETLSSAFLELVRSTARNYGGEVFSWSPRGGT